MEKPVSVLLSVRNVEKTIAKCLTAILNQSFSQFELVILDSLSTDGTKKEIAKFNDIRIKLVETNKPLSLTQARNESLYYANGKYVFFTDGDCTVDADWISNGLATLKNDDCIGAEGKTYYVSKQYKATRSDDIVDNIRGGQYNTCNIAYKKEIFDKISCFDENLNYHEDRDFALRAQKHGKIVFNPKMLVYHQKKTVKPKEFVRTGKRLKYRVLLYKKFGEKPLFMGRVAYPINLASIIFPPLLFGSLLRNRFESKADYDLFPYTYLQLIYERIVFWEMCARERVFLI